MKRPLLYCVFNIKLVIQHQSTTKLSGFVSPFFCFACSDSALGGALDIVDSNGKIQRYTSDQLFFLTYCRRFCNKHTSCNLAVRSLADFNSVFGCSKRRPEEDDLSQYRFFA
ncbi:hypothetical protein MRX96_014937 [Rhipicephalus microplus]